jgi:hypothetical protein
MLQYVHAQFRLFLPGVSTGTKILRIGMMKELVNYILLFIIPRLAINEAKQFMIWEY